MNRLDVLRKAARTRSVDVGLIPEDVKGALYNFFDMYTDLKMAGSQGRIGVKPYLGFVNHVLDDTFLSGENMVGTNYAKKLLAAERLIQNKNEPIYGAELGKGIGCVFPSIGYVLNADGTEKAKNSWYKSDGYPVLETVGYDTISTPTLFFIGRDTVEKGLVPIFQRIGPKQFKLASLEYLEYTIDRHAKKDGITPKLGSEKLVTILTNVMEKHAMS